MKQNVYAIYKGDRFIDVGTVKELAKNLKVSEKTVQFMATPTYRKRCKNNNRIQVFKIEDDE